MDSVNLNLYHMHTIGHSSKGNQLKGRDGNYWYKADYMGYEGLSEYMVSHLMEYSNLDRFVSYDMVRIISCEKQCNGCRSVHFLEQDENIITLEHLYRQFTGQGLSQKISQIREVADKIRWVVGIVEDITGIFGFGEYLTAMLELDAFFLNEDRHTNNIAVIYNKKSDSYRLCEYFDHVWAAAFFHISGKGFVKGAGARQEGVFGRNMWTCGKDSALSNPKI